MLYFARFGRWMCVMKRVRNSFSSKPNPFGCSRAWHALHEIIMHRMMNGYLVKTSDSTTNYNVLQSNKRTIPRCECVLYIMSWSLIENNYFVWLVRSLEAFFFFSRSTFARFVSNLKCARDARHSFFHHQFNAPLCVWTLNTHITNVYYSDSCSIVYK